MNEEIDYSKRFAMIDTCFDELVELKNFVSTVQIGFEQAEELVSLTNSMHEISLKLGREYVGDIDKKIKDAEKLERFAKNQAELKYPYLYNLALVRTWSILEAFADEVAMSRLRNCKIDSFEEFKKVKITISEFISMEKDEQLETMLAAYKNSKASNLKKGNGRFKLVLNATGVNGAVDEWAERILLEMCEIRNSLTHRSGAVDMRMKESCPWLKDLHKDKVALDFKSFVKYWLIAFWYVAKIKVALFASYGEVPEGDWDKAIKGIHEKITELSK